MFCRRGSIWHKMSDPISLMCSPNLSSALSSSDLRLTSSVSVWVAAPAVVLLFSSSVLVCFAVMVLLCSSSVSV